MIDGCRQRTESWVPNGRALHLIDIENLLGKNPAEASPSEFVQAAAKYEAVAGPAAIDHLIVGCDPVNAIDAATALPGARLVTRRGPDGGETAILDSLDADDIARRYEHVYIASGDCAFTWLLYELIDRAVPVTFVVASKRSLSRRVARALASDESEVIYLDDHRLTTHGKAQEESNENPEAA